MLRPWFVPGRGMPNWHEDSNRSEAAAIGHRMERRRGAVFLPKIGRVRRMGRTRTPRFLSSV